MSHAVTLTPADLDTISGGGTVTVTPERGLVFEVTSEAGWSPSSVPGACRFALSPAQLDRLRWGRTATVLPVDLDGSVEFTVEALEAAR